MNRPRAVLVVAYGAPDYLRGALAPLPDERVVVVDNSSRSDTRDVVMGHGHSYVASANLGFAAGVNLGLRYLKAEGFAGDVLLLNPDAVIDSDGIERLQQELAADDGLAAIGPALVTGDGLWQLTKYPLPSPEQMWRLAVRLPLGPRAVDFVNGAVVMLRFEALVDIGEFDERYFLYGEEVDWQRRAFDRGWRIAEASSVTASHLVGMSSDDDEVRVARVTAGQETYVRRWFGTRGWMNYRVAAWVASVLRVIGPGDGAAARVRARCFRLGPRRVAPLPPAPRSLSIVHLAADARTDDRVLVLAKAQAANGHMVTVVSCGPAPADPRGVRWCRADDGRAVAKAVRDAPADVVHAHGERSTLLACVTGSWHGARVVTSPGDESSSLARAMVRLVRRRVDLWLPRSGVSDAAEGYRAAT